MFTLIKRYSLLLIFLPYFLAVVSGCHRIPQSPAVSLSIEEWMQIAPDSCMWHYTDLYVPLTRQKMYDSLEHAYSRILRSMPDPVPGHPDSLAYIAGWVVSLYYNVRMLQDKVEDGARLTDSLAASSNPFYACTLRPELLSVTAKFYVAERRIDRVDSLGRLFEQLKPTSKPLRDIRAWHNMAWALEYCDLNTRRAIALQQHAVDLFRQGLRGNGDWEVISQMGRLYFKNGDYELATALLQEAIDWMTTYPDTPGDGLIYAYNDLSSLYTTLGLYDKALEANSRAIEQSVATDGWLLDESYRHRAACFSQAGRPDSALRWVVEAEKIIPEGMKEALLPALRIEKMAYFMACYPDSAGYCLEECRLMLEDTARMEPEWKTDMLALYGRALLQTPGRTQEGRDYLERSYHDYYEAGRPREAVQLAEYLVRVYLDGQHAHALSSFYPTFASLRDSLWTERSRLAAIGANIRYETGRREQENRILATEVELKEKSLALNRLVAGGIIVVLLLLAVGVAIYSWLSRRYYRAVGRARLLRISGLLDMQRELQERNKRLATDLLFVEQRCEAAVKRMEEVRAGMEAEKAAAEAEMKKAVAEAAELKKERTRIEEEQGRIAGEFSQKENELRESLGGRVLKADEELKFRRSFMSVYPLYLTSLRRHCPDLTRTDELIAMLLLLNYSNYDIAMALNITKSSVNKARTRMRRRLGLADTGMVLEDFLKKVGEENEV